MTQMELNEGKGRPGPPSGGTPGPWVAPSDRRDRWVRGAGGVGVCQLPVPQEVSPSFPHLQVEAAFRISADAALIAAAPDMLRALRDLLPLAESRAEDMDESADLAEGDPTCPADQAAEARAFATHAAERVEAARRLISDLVAPAIAKAEGR